MSYVSTDPIGREIQNGAPVGRPVHVPPALPWLWFDLLAITFHIQTVRGTSTVV
jgi:hypothetical protein